MTDIQTLSSEFQESLEHSFERAPASKVFLRSASSADLTYGELNILTRKAISLFRSIKLAPQSRILIASKNERLVSVLLFAALREGIIPILADSESVATEISKTIDASSPSAVFLDAGLLTSSISEKLRAINVSVFTIEPLHNSVGATAPFDDLGQFLYEQVETAPAPMSRQDDVALIIYTSGTTSNPKGVQLTYQNISAQMQMFNDVYGFDQDDTLLNLLPLHHVDGLIRGLLVAFHVCATVSRPKKFQVSGLPDILDKIKNTEITHLILVPTILALIEKMDAAFDDTFQQPHFKYVISSADLLNENLWRRFEDRFNVMIVNSYGLSETVCDSLFCGPAANTRKVGTLGKPAGCETLIMGADNQPVSPGEIGELYIKGPHITKGYFQQPAETRKAFYNDWFKTGDLVSEDSDGFIHFEGRLKTVIVSGGVNIHPENINKVLMMHDGISEAATIGVPDDIWGQKAVACIVPTPSNSVSEIDVIKFCRDNLPAEKIPHNVVILDMMPRVPSGKVDMQTLLEIALQNLNIQTTSNDDHAPDVFEIAAKCFKVDRHDLSPESSPYNTAGWDSLAHVNFLHAIEEIYKIEISPIDIINLNSLADACEIVGQKY